MNGTLIFTLELKKKLKNNKIEKREYNLNVACTCEQVSSKNYVYLCDYIYLLLYQPICLSVRGF